MKLQRFLILGICMGLNSAVMAEDIDPVIPDGGVTTQDEGVTTQDDVVTIQDEGLTTQDEGVTIQEPDSQEWKLPIPELKPTLVQPADKVIDLSMPESQSIDLMSSAGSAQPSYKFLDDISWAGIPVFLAGIIAKGEKQAFRQDYRNSHANTRLVTSFKTSIDDHLQFFSPVMAVGLKLGGVKGRSDWTRFLTSAAMSYGLMAGFVNSIKYTASEMRPDGSTRNSWPSGHTATAFVGATILHKEYGLTQSPWFSVLGYGMATATGVMRVLNNRHWVSDVLSGAGIGIMSGELGYAFSDLIFKNRHLVRGDLTDHPNLNRDHPSFFDVSMGMGFGSRNIDFDNVDTYSGEKSINLKFRTATVVQAEGAYFLNKFFGIGGRLRVRTSPINGWSNFMQIAEQDVATTLKDLQEMETDMDEAGLNPTNMKMSDMITDKEITIESDHLTEFAGDVGFYFNIPLNDRWAIGTKLLIGRSIMQALDINAKFMGQVKDMDYNLTVSNGMLTDLNINSITNLKDDAGEDVKYETSWDYITVDGNNSTKWGTGISLTYAYKGNFCWKVFFDFDRTRKTYTLTYDPEHYMAEAMPKIEGLYTILLGEATKPYVYKTKKYMNTWVLGASFSISF